MVLKTAKVVLAVIICVFLLTPSSWAQFGLPGFSAVSSLIDTQSLKGSVQVGYYHNRVSLGGSQDNPLSGGVNTFGLIIDPVASYGGATINYTLQGITVGLTCQGDESISLPGLGRMGFLAGAWYFFPGRGSRATESWDSFFQAPLTSIGDRATWDAVPEWWRLEGFLSSQITAGFKLLFGLRWEHLYTKFKNPEAPHDNLQANFYGPDLITYPVPFHTSGDEAEVGGSGPIPLIGVQADYGNDSTSLKIVALGCPFFTRGFGMTKLDITFGEVGQFSVGNKDYRFTSHGDVNSGFMFELSADYETNFGGLGRFGAFFKYHHMFAKIDFNASHESFDLPFTSSGVPGTLISPFSGGGPGNGVMRQNSIMVGGTWSMDFRIPGI